MPIILKIKQGRIPRIEPDNLLTTKQSSSYRRVCTEYHWSTHCMTRKKTPHQCHGTSKKAVCSNGFPPPFPTNISSLQSKYSFLPSPSTIPLPKGYKTPLHFPSQCHTHLRSIAHQTSQPFPISAVSKKNKKTRKKETKISLSLPPSA